MHFHLVEREVFAEIGGVRKAHALDGDEVVLHLDDDGRLALEVGVQRDLAARQSAADDDDLVPDGRAAQIVARFDALVRPFHGHAPRGRARRNDDLVESRQRVRRAHLCVEADVDLEILHLLFIPFEERFIGTLEGGRRRRHEHAAE